MWSVPKPLKATMQGQEGRAKKKSSKLRRIDPEEGTPVHITWPTACRQACREGQLGLRAHVYVSSVRLSLILLLQHKSRKKMTWDFTPLIAAADKGKDCMDEKNDRDKMREARDETEQHRTALRTGIQNGEEAWVAFLRAAKMLSPASALKFLAEPPSAASTSLTSKCLRPRT